MEERVNVTYYYHSGFSVAKGGVLLIFDYWRGERGELPEDKQITADTLACYDEIYVFVSHEHPDHLDAVVKEWSKLPRVTCVVSGDMPIGTPGKRMNPGDERRFSPRVSVKTFDSTDLGVSFLVDVDGFHVFHAGDLNFWHWRDESTVREIDEADEAFRKAVDPIMAEEIDLAFFPVDPRQGRMYDAGANYFILSVKPRLLIPMHFWGRADIATEFARRSRCEQTEVIAMTRCGEQMLLTLDEEGYMTINLQSAAPASSSINLTTYETEGPFTDTDLPVKLDE